MEPVNRLRVEDNVPDKFDNSTFSAITDYDLVFAIQEIAPNKCAIVAYSYYDLEMGQAETQRRHPILAVFQADVVDSAYADLVGLTSYEALQRLGGLDCHRACRRCSKPVVSINECQYCRYYRGSVHMNDAYRLGGSMARDGNNIGSNPYSRGTGSWSEWRRGWKAWRSEQ